MAALPILLLWHDPGEYLRPIYLVLWVERGGVGGNDFGGYHRPQWPSNETPADRAATSEVG